ISLNTVDTGALVYIKQNNGNFFLSKKQYRTGVALGDFADLVDGMNTFVIRSISSDSTKILNYIVNIYRTLSNTKIDSLSLNSYDAMQLKIPLSPVFRSDTFNYNATVFNYIGRVQVNPYVFTTGQTLKVKINDSPYVVLPSSNPNRVVSLDTGMNIIKVLVQNADSSIIRVYNINVFRKTIVGPGVLNFSDTVINARVGQPIDSIKPSNTGDPIDSYFINPTLTNGLYLHPTKGIIYGTPTTASASTIYTISGYCFNNSSISKVRITVSPAVVAKVLLDTLTLNSFDSLGLKVPLTPVFHSDTLNYNSTVFNYVSQLQINPSSKDSTLTLKVKLNNGSYFTLPKMAPNRVVSIDTGMNIIKVLVQNADSSTVKVYTINIRRKSIVGPGVLTYSDTVINARVGQPIDSIRPANNGDPIDSYFISPALPNGMYLHPTKGIIYGTPTVTFASTIYTITGYCFNNSSIRRVRITVSPAIVAKVLLDTLTLNSFDSLGLKVPLTPVFHSDTLNYNSTVFNYVSQLQINPSSKDSTLTLKVKLNNGSYFTLPKMAPNRVVSIDTGMNIIKVLVQNADSSTVKVYTINIRRKSIVGPGVLTYSDTVINARVGQPIDSIRPANNGDPIDSYFISPALPNGLFLHPTKGIIYGIPTVATASTIYTISGFCFSNSSISKVRIIVSPSISVKNAQNSQFESLAIYPNPFTDNLSLSFNAIENSAAQFEIVDAVGRKVYGKKLTFKVGVNYFDINDLPNLKLGLYFVNITDENANIKTIKLIKAN
ncbi:MAG: cadherin-like beta sandwich domain-containing protein, partial [Bacteroidia bacterium]|nr:cadherin-like beta sandwich domain-containing protein [Bacteroidia bacterium]